MNNCIGLKNHKSFILFNMYTALSACYAGVRGIIEIGLCFSDDYVCNTYKALPWRIFGFAAFAMCGLFTLFTTIMFCDQVYMKYEDTSTIDSMKARAEKTTTSKPKKSLIEALGGWTPWWWIPVPMGTDHSVES